MQNILKSINEKIFFPIRFKLLTRAITPHLNDCFKVLDLGASCGRLADKLKSLLPGREFVGADTHIQPKTYIKVHKYNGKKLPFPDNSFDCIMIVDVLHHTEDIAEVLAEARRVTKKYILIKDHYWENRLDLKISKIADYIANKPYNIALPYNFQKLDSWLKIIKGLKLKIKNYTKFFMLPDIQKHLIFKLVK